MPNCDGCGAQCCKFIRIYQKLSDDEMMWWAYHKLSVSEVEGHPGLYQIDIPAECSKLDENGKCTLFKDELARPEMCKTFDCDKPEFGFKRKLPNG